MHHHSYENFVESAEAIKKLLPADFVPEIGVICGSGLSGIQQAVTGPRVEVPYNEIKGFPVSTGRPNHDSRIYIATLTILFQSTAMLACLYLATLEPTRHL